MKKQKSKKDIGIELSKTFNVSLQKLEGFDTVERGLRECKEVFAKYNTIDDLNQILSILSKVIINVHTTSMFKENIIILMGFLPVYFGGFVIDKFSKIFSLMIKTFRIDKTSLQQSNARSITEIYNLSLQQEPVLLKEKLLFVKLIEMMKMRKEPIIQSTAGLVIYELLLLMLKNGFIEDFKYISTLLIAIFQDIEVQSEESIAIYSIIFSKIDIVTKLDQKVINSFVSSLLQVIKRKNELTKVEMGIKAECCKALDSLLVLVDLKEDLDRDVKYELVNGIKDCTYHKIPKVRSSAKSLMDKLYNKSDDVRTMIDQILEGEPLDISQAEKEVAFPKKRIFDHLDDNKSIDLSLPLPEEKKPSTPSSPSSKLRFKRNLHKKLSQPQISLEPHSKSPDSKRGLFIIQDPLLEMTSGKGWGANVRGKGFLRRGTNNDKNAFEMEIKDMIGSDIPRALIDRISSGNISQEELQELVIAHRMSKMDIEEITNLIGEKYATPELIKAIQEKKIEPEQIRAMMIAHNLTSLSEEKIKELVGEATTPELILAIKNGELDPAKVKLLIANNADNRDNNNPFAFIFEGQEGANLVADGTGRLSQKNMSGVKISESQARLTRNKQRSKERRKEFKKMISANKKSSRKMPSKQKFSMIDRKAERARRRRLKKIKQGIDPDIPTPDGFQSDLDDSGDNSAFDELQKKQTKMKEMEDLRLSHLLNQLDKTMHCPEEEAEDIAVDKAIARYLAMKEGSSSLKLNSGDIWKLVLLMLEKEDYSKAFELLLRLGDDIYFLRACISSGGKVIGKLHKRTAAKVLKRLAEIRIGNRLLATGLTFIETGIKANMLDLVDHNASMDTLKALDNIGCNFDDKIRRRALYLKELTQEIIKFN